MKVGIFTRYNDTDNIIEFMKYHYSIGINYILIYNDGSSNKLDECKKHFSKDMFKIVYFKWIDKNDIHKLNYSRQFYENILKILRKKNVDYCFHIDNDEYIVLQKFINIHQLVNHYKPFDQVYFNWIFFGDNNIYTSSTLSTLLDKNNKSEMFVSSDEPKVLINVKTAISASSPHFFDRFNKDKRTNIINKNVFNKSGVPLTNRYKPYNNHDVYIYDIPAYIAHFSIVTLKDFYKKRFNHVSGSRLAKPLFNNNNFINAVKKNYILIYLLTILKIKKEDFSNMITTSPSPPSPPLLASIIDPFYTMIDLYLKRNRNECTNTTFNKFINNNPELYAYHHQKCIINITKDIIIKMINKINTTKTTFKLTQEATKVIVDTINNSTMEEIVEYGLYSPAYNPSSC
jgi:hypothetical protein